MLVLIFFMICIVILISLTITGGVQQKYRFRDLHKNHKSYLISFFRYIIKIFDYPSSIQDVLLKNINKSDAEIYTIMRANLHTSNTDYINYDARVNALYSLLSSYNIKSILDVGTETALYLDALQTKFGVRVSGLNIDVGFSHYSKEFDRLRSDNRFKLYDGKTFPFADGEFDCIVTTSVIHHISTNDLKKYFIPECARVCKRFVYIKDVDLCNNRARDFYNIQHEIFEGRVCSGNTSYRNEHITFNIVKTIFEKNEMNIVYKQLLENFNNTYFALFQKK